jgi:hypothetical protein
LLLVSSILPYIISSPVAITSTLTLPLCFISEFFVMGAYTPFRQLILILPNLETIKDSYEGRKMDFREGS